ncbi:MAG TPA: FixH family protein [Methylophilaceae bacterium]|jgi:hypothetical protein
MMETKQSQPWWKYGYAWLVISGPLIVVAASFTSLYLALLTPDQVVDDYYRKGIEINKTLTARGISLAPAMLARNHAASGVIPPRPVDD